jgi:hypothetical protein
MDATIDRADGIVSSHLDDEGGELIETGELLG